MKISKEKTKNVANNEKELIKTKIILDNKVFEWVSEFKYLGCDTSFYKNRLIINCIKTQIIVDP